MQVTIIGGTRGLGYWIADFLKNNEFRVTITGRDKMMGKDASEKLGVFYVSNNIEAVSKADVVIISVPIDSAPSVIKDVAPYLKEGSLIMDVTSVKEEASETMQESVPSGVEFLPTHPMFSPRVQSLDGQVIVLTPTMKGEWYNRVLNFLKSENARVIETTPAIHDKMMSIVQGLTHFAYISIAVTLKRLQVDLKESRRFASPVYDLMLDMIARIASQNPYMYYSIQTRNRYIKDVHREFISIVNYLNDMIHGCDEGGFVDAMSSAAKYLDDIEASLGRSDKAINALTDELRVLKLSVGDEIGLRHIYSGKVHIGTLLSVSPDFVSLNCDDKLMDLKISNIEVLTSEELKKYKYLNYPCKGFDVSVVFPDESDPNVIVNTIKRLDNVVNARVKDVYYGFQIKSGFKSITINYEVLDNNARVDVEKLLKGFGGVIR